MRHWFKPNGGGQVEKNVRDARHHAKGVLAARRLWQVMPAFPDLESLNHRLEERCKVLWAETAHGTLAGSIADIWQAEKPDLMALPIAFDGFFELSKRVSPTRCPAAHACMRERGPDHL